MTFICEECREELKRQPQPVPGYQMIKMLGRGGMGCVMLARDEKSGRAVAIKTLLPEVAVTNVALRRFMREIDVGAALEHPNIVRYIESGTHNGAVYLVTEYVEGSDAARLADSQGGRLPYKEAIDIVAQSLDALAYAHGLGYIHRDIKESNILLTGSSPSYTAKLTDFGLAKSFTNTGMSGITMAGDMAGTFRLHAARTDQRLPQRQTHLGYLCHWHDCLQLACRRDGSGRRPCQVTWPRWCGQSSKDRLFRCAVARPRCRSALPK